MAAYVQIRPQERNLGVVMKEVDEDLAIFLEMRRREKENNDLNLIQKSNDYHDSIASNPDSIVVSDPKSAVIVDETCAVGSLLDAQKDQKSDYDWLVSSHGTSSIPSVEMEVQGTAASQPEASNTLPIEQKAEPENPSDESSLSIDASGQPSTSTDTNSSAPGNRRPSSSGGQKSTTARFPTPTRLLGLPATSKPSRSSTPTARGTTPSSKPIVPLVRSSRTTARSSTPPARSSIPSTSKSTSRPATPTRKPSIPSITHSNPAPSSRSSSVNKTRPSMVKNTGQSRGTSPTVRSRPKQPTEVPTSSSDAPPNLKIVVPKRPSSAFRGRPITSSVKSSSADVFTVKPRQKSCSPSRGRISTSANTILTRSRGYSNGNDDVNPVLMGTQMVERVVNMRKLAPPKQDIEPSSDNPTKKSSGSQDKSGFGRSLSKKSLDMAIRHMDIRRSINGNLNTLVKSVPASSVYSLLSGSMKFKTLSASNSPHATSSSASSSEPSANNSSSTFYSSDVEVNDIGSARESSSPTSQQNEKSGELVGM